MAKQPIQKWQKISAGIGHVKSQQGRQQVSISAQGSGVIMYYFHTRTGCPWSMESWKLFGFQMIQKETLICGLEKVSAEDSTEATLLTQPFHWTQQLHMNKCSQSYWICSNTGSRGVWLLELVIHPWPWQTQLQSCASNSELASTTYQAWGFYINSILLKRIVNNQRAPNARRHKMLPGVQKPHRLFTRQTRA